MGDGGSTSKLFERELSDPTRSAPGVSLTVEGVGGAEEDICWERVLRVTACDPGLVGSGRGRGGVLGRTLNRVNGLLRWPGRLRAFQGLSGRQFTTGFTP